MKNKHNITILKGPVPAITKKDIPNVDFIPIFGSLKAGMFSRLGQFSDVYILDIGPSFFNMGATEEVLKNIRTYGIKAFHWIDHHPWPNNITNEFKDILKVKQALSCAEIVEPERIEKTSRTAILYGGDCDGLISAVLLAGGDHIKPIMRKTLVAIAGMCDSANFINSPIATLLHKAVHMTKQGSTSKDLNILISELLTWAVNDMNNIKRCAPRLLSLAKKYDEEMMSTNRKILNSPIFYMNDVIAYNTSNIKWADLSYVCSYAYNQRSKYILFVNNGGVTITTNAKDVDLTKEFDIRGINQKIFLQKKNIALQDLFEIIIKLQEIGKQQIKKSA